MKSCAMCRTDQEEVNVVVVAPATWNDFNNFAEVCTDCQNSRKFKQAARPKVAAAKKAAQKAADAAEVEMENSGVKPVPKIEVRHRRTGVVLHTLEARTLDNATLSGASLSGADLQNASLRGAVLLKADLHLADLSNADLRGADLRGVNFRGADLRGTDLRDTKLIQADLNHVLHDVDTRWPAGYQPVGARR